MFVYELSGCGFKSRYSNLNFRYRAVSSKKFLDIQANIELWNAFHSEIRTWHDNNIQSIIVSILSKLIFHIFHFLMIVTELSESKVYGSDIGNNASEFSQIKNIVFS